MKPLIGSKLALTIPDRPNSRYQKYQTILRNSVVIALTPSQATFHPQSERFFPPSHTPRHLKIEREDMENLAWRGCVFTHQAQFKRGGYGLEMHKSFERKTREKGML